MNKPEWIEYTGSDEQIKEIDSGDNDILFRLENGKVMLECELNGYWLKPFIGVTHYLICQPHPYADLIKIWADTGCPVWIQVTRGSEDGDWLENLPPTNIPDWNIPAAGYRLTPFED